MGQFDNISLFNFTVSVYHERILVGLLYIILSIAGLLLEILILYIVFRQKGVKLTSFYTFLVSVIAAESVAFQLYLLYASPCVLSASQIYGEKMANFLGNFETIDFLALVCITLVISLNRALSLSGSRLYYKIFTKNLCIVYIVGSWVLATIAVGVDLALGCKTAFLENNYYFAELCGSQSPALTATSLTIYVGVYAVALLYGYCIWILWKHRKRIGSDSQQMRDNMGKRKRMLFYQALCIWATLFVNVISFRIIPEFLQGLSAVLLTALIVLGRNFVNPICMLIFNSDIRVAAKNIMLCREINYAVSGGKTQIFTITINTNVYGTRKDDSQAE